MMIQDLEIEIERLRAVNEGLKALIVQTNPIERDLRAEIERLRAPVSLEEQIEKIIDEASLQSTLEAIIAVCDAKAEHVRRQDEHLAAGWTRAANELNFLLINL